MIKKKHRKKILSYLILACFTFSCQQTENEVRLGSDYVQQIKRWHQNRIDRLTQPDSWLSLAGLYWLEEGENSFGAHPENDLVFPADKVPDFIGSFLLEDSMVTVEIRPEVEVLHRGKPVHEKKLQNDMDGEPSKLSYGSLTWYIIKRGNNFAVRLKDSQNPALKNFGGIETYPVDPKWRIEAHFQSYEPVKTIQVPNVTGTVNKRNSPGALIFQIEDQTYQLDAIAENRQSRFFIIFADKTNGNETYGGGRFLYTDPPDSNDIVAIDFNKAYNPPCVFTPYATCPLPPAQNSLNLHITAGEKNYHAGSH